MHGLAQQLEDDFRESSGGRCLRRHRTLFDGQLSNTMSASRRCRLAVWARFWGCRAWGAVVLPGGGPIAVADRLRNRRVVAHFRRHLRIFSW